MISRSPLESPFLSEAPRTLLQVAWDPWEQEEIEVRQGRIRHAKGAYLPTLPAIVVQSGLTEIESRAVLAHELGHHYYRHHPTDDPSEESRQELKAARWAAAKLVSLSDIAMVIDAGLTLYEAAEELGVDPELLEVRARWLTDAERREVGLE